MNAKFFCGHFESTKPECCHLPSERSGRWLFVNQTIGYSLSCPHRASQQHLALKTKWYSQQVLCLSRSQPWMQSWGVWRVVFDVAKQSHLIIGQSYVTAKLCAVAIVCFSRCLLNANVCYCALPLTFLSNDLTVLLWQMRIRWCHWDASNFLLCATFCHITELRLYLGDLNILRKKTVKEKIM